MLDIPMFTTQLGVASLILKEIPGFGLAYVKIHDASEPEGFIKECADFCRTAGAEAVIATGHSALERYPFHTAIWEMRCSRDSLPDTDAALIPVQEQTLERWRQIYNNHMRSVPNASFMTDTKARQMLQKGNGYYIHRGDLLLGIGMAGGDTIEALVSVMSGCGKDVLLALAHALYEDQIRLTVASENKKAVRLYERLGFIRSSELERWYKIF